VIIPVYNAIDTLDAQLRALADQESPVPFDVTVVDNASTDGTADLIRRFVTDHPNFRLVEATDRQGSSHARNVGVAATTGDLICFCESDDLVDPGWIAGLVSAAATHDLVGGALDVTRINTELALAWRAWWPPPDRLPSAMGLTIVVGANCAVWRDVLDAVGGWNEAIDVQTDRELAWRVQLAGHDVGFAPRAVVQYRYRSDLKGVMKQAYRYGRSDATLVRMFRGEITRPSNWRALRVWASLVRHLPDLAHSPATRGRWLNRAAWRAGRVAGSIRARTLVL
jgi:glycosyltransferase involved in cell wall biosynthesis